MLTKLTRFRQIQYNSVKYANCRQLQGTQLHSQFALRGLFEKKEKGKRKNLEEVNAAMAAAVTTILI